MDYEKTLKEALNSKATPFEVSSWIEEQFPELKESEDERMIKSFIRLLKAFYDVNFPTPEGFEREDMIAWLEKQGEKGVVLRDTFGYEEGRKKGREEGIMLVLDNPHKYGLEKQGEQNPIEEYKITGIGSKNARGKLGEMLKNLEPVNEALEQNPAWSEEDENRFKNLIELVKQSDEGQATKIGFIGFINRLKSLKDRVQPKQEWSEEDNTFFKAIIRDIENIQYISEDAKKDRINWLKFLKDRYTWKPSDEQMEALEYATENCAPSEYQNCLRGLIEQLKKLREE